MIWKSYEGCQIIGSQSNENGGVRRPRYALNAIWSCQVIWFGCSTDYKEPFGGFLELVMV